MKIDFHIHTKESPCSNMEFEKIVEVAISKGLDGIAVVDHNKMKVRKCNKNFLIIWGEEIKTKEGEIIGLGIKKEIKKGMGAQETINEIHKQGGIVIAPHPFDILRKGVGKRVFDLKGIDAMEINGRNWLKRFTKKTFSVAKKMKIPLVGGSDAHFYGEIGRVYTEVNASSIQEIFEKIKKGEARVIQKDNGYPFKWHLRTFLHKLKRW